MSSQPNESDPRIPLGRRIASYHATGPSCRVIALTLLTGGIAVVLAWKGVPDAVSRWLLVFGLACLFVAGVMIRRRRVTRRIDLHQFGLHWIEGRRYTVVLWTQVREFYQAPVFNQARVFLSVSRPPANWTCRIVCRDGRVFRISGYEGIRALGQRIQAEIAERLSALVVESFQCGYVTRFGRRIAVSDEGIHIGFSCLSWQEIADISFDDEDSVRVARAGSSIEWIRIPVSQVANLQILAQLIDSIGNAAARVAKPFAADPLGPSVDNRGRAGTGNHRLDSDADVWSQPVGDDSVPDSEFPAGEDLIRASAHRPRRPR